jgi:phospholipid transport system transporter-binding protein
MAFNAKGTSATVEVVEVRPDRVQVKGALTFATARAAREAGLAILERSSSSEPLTVDCSGVGASDSAGLAVLIDLLANATKRGRTLQFWNLPSGIVAAAKISDVDTMLGIA